MTYGSTIPSVAKDVDFSIIRSAFHKATASQNHRLYVHPITPESCCHLRLGPTDLPGLGYLPQRPIHVLPSDKLWVSPDSSPQTA